MAGVFERVWTVAALDFTSAGRASTGIKDTLKRLGVVSSIVRRIATATYEAEMNVVMHSRGGTITLHVTPEEVAVEAADLGPGIEDIELAMQDGYSTATPEMREMGFGAGMGLSNMKRNSDAFEIVSSVGHGTRVRLVVRQRGGTPT